MIVEYSGWSEEKGSFHYNVFLNEASIEYEIEYEDGFIAEQTSIFKNFTLDWNHDGDEYTLFGAWFKSRHGGEEFFTPEDLVRSLIDGVEGVEDGYNYRVVAVKGIELPETMKPEVSKRKGR